MTKILVQFKSKMIIFDLSLHDRDKTRRIEFCIIRVPVRFRRLPYRLTLLLFGFRSLLMLSTSYHSFSMRIQLLVG